MHTANFFALAAGPHPRRVSYADTAPRIRSPRRSVAAGTARQNTNRKAICITLGDRVLITWPNRVFTWLPAAATGFLASAAGQIKRLPANTVLEIAGYTDSVGDPAANLTLSQQRADAVRSELVRNGVASSMLVAKGYGDAKPIASNDSAEGRFRNRRIEYHVLP